MNVPNPSVPVVLPAGPADAEEIAELFLAARADSMSYLPELHSDDETRWWISNVVLPDHDVHLLRGRPGGELLGFAAVRGSWLEHLYVCPTRQGEGHGARLLDHVRARHPGELWLHVFQRNLGARRFYERHRFTLLELGDGSGNEEHEPDATYGGTVR